MYVCCEGSFANHVVKPSLYIFSGRDYCYVAQPNSLRPRIPECSEEQACGACYGDCDSDAQCLPGLTCGMRGTDESTPLYGCSGVGIAGLDYCYNSSAIPPTNSLVNADGATTPTNSTEMSNSTVDVNTTTRHLLRH